MKISPSTIVSVEMTGREHVIPNPSADGEESLLKREPRFLSHPTKVGFLRNDCALIARGKHG